MLSNYLVVGWLDPNVVEFFAFHEGSFGPQKLDVRPGFAMSR